MTAMIRRGVQVVLVMALVGSAWVFRPVAATPDPVVGFEPEVPTYVGCVVRADRVVSGSISVGSIVRGEVLFTRVPEADQDPTLTAIDPAGGTTVPLDDLGAAGDVGVLVEMPTADAGAATVLFGADTVAGAGCTPASSGVVMALGGSTGNGEQLDLVLTNPYAVDAVVRVGSSSENGEDSASEIASVLVPAGGTVVRDLDSLLPLRQSLSVRMEADRGAVHAALIQTTSNDLAVSEAVAAAQDWWLPALAVSEATSRLVVATDSPLPVNIQIDTYKAGTINEAAVEATLDARSQLDFDVADLGGAPLGLRVSSDAPVVAALVVDGASTRAVSPGTTLASEWVLPGTGLVAGGRAWVFNPGEVDAELVLQPLAEGEPARAATVPARAAVSIRLDPAGSGTLIRSSSEIAVMWSSRAGGLSLVTGTPTSVLAE